MSLPNQGLALNIANLTAGYGNRKVLNSISLDPIPSGMVTALVGPNAAGKSTLLRAIAGLIPTTGSISLGDLNLQKLKHIDRAKHVTFMPQSMPFGVSLSVLEVVMSAIKASPLSEGSDTTSVDERALRVLERIGIGDIALRALDQLSGGQRQMVSLAQVIARNPKLLLLDEPTSALDLRHQVQVMQLVHDLAQEGRAVVVVMHDLSLAARWAQHLVVFSEGHAVAQGSPEEAITEPLLEEVYGVKARVERCSQNRITVIVDSAV